MKKSAVLAIVVLLVLAMAIPVGAQAPDPEPGDPSGSGVQPILIQGNPDCIDLGYTYGFKPQSPGEPEPPLPGTYHFTNDDGELYPGDAPSLPEESVTITRSASNPPEYGKWTHFDWESTWGIYAVIVKGGPVGDAYVYYPPQVSFGDTELHPPINPSNGEPYGISHIDFCYPSESTAITLASFVAAPGVGGINLDWETGTEVDNAGFNLYRATAPDGSYTKVNDALIAAQGDPVSGASYSFLDKGIAPGTYYYKLEDVDYYGVTTLHGPLSTTVLPRLRRPAFRPAAP